MFTSWWFAVQKLFHWEWESHQHTVECSYNMVQYSMILHTSLQWLRRNINHGLGRKIHSILCPNWWAVGCILLGFGRTAPYCPFLSTKLDVMDQSDCIRFQFNTLRPRQNGRHVSDDIFKCILLKENMSISINISLKFVPKGLINNLPALVQIMAWRRPGDRPLSEPMMVNLLMHICVARPQLVKTCFWQIVYTVIGPRSESPHIIGKPITRNHITA